MKIGLQNALTHVELENNEPFQRRDFKTKEIVLNEEGNPTWQVRVSVPGERSREFLTVNVASATNPVEGLKPGSPLKLGNATLSIGTIERSGEQRRQWWSISADSIAKA